MPGDSAAEYDNIKEMGDDFDFRTMMRDRPRRRRRNNIVQFRRPTRWRRRRGRQISLVPLIVCGLIIGSAIGWAALEYGDKLPGWPAAASEATGLGVGCVSPVVVDGDTLRCGSTRIRLSSIDAPEMPGHCRPGRECTPGDPYASTGNLRSLVNGQAVECRQVDTDHYGRAVARCSVRGQDLSCAQVEGGFAVRRYGFLVC